MTQRKVRRVVVEMLLPVGDDYNRPPRSRKIDAVLAIHKLLPNFPHWSIIEESIEERDLRD